jgi:hypothetical protein
MPGVRLAARFRTAACTTKGAWNGICSHDPRRGQLRRLGAAPVPGRRSRGTGPVLAARSRASESSPQVAGSVVAYDVAALLAAGEWVSLELDLASAPPGFHASQVAQIGVQVGASEPSAGPFVLAIESLGEAHRVVNEILEKIEL